MHNTFVIQVERSVAYVVTSHVFTKLSKFAWTCPSNIEVNLTELSYKAELFTLRR